MILVRPSQKRGRTVLRWLDSFHTFSFGDYMDPANRGFSVLRVINEDKVQAQTGFPTHGHQDMEIITFVLSGVLSHKDSLGNTSQIHPGDVQRMSAGIGVEHSEFNGEDQPCHFLQIWMFPLTRGTPASYEQKSFGDKYNTQKLTLVVSRDGASDSVKVNQDAKIFVGNFQAGDSELLPIENDRKYWIQMISGTADVGGQVVKMGDGLSIQGENTVRLSAQATSRFLFFDLPI